MNEVEFWGELQKTIDNNSGNSQLAQLQWDRLIQLRNTEQLPTELIIQTVCQGSVYLTQRALLNFPAITPDVSLSGHQELALEMALSNSAIALIAGSPASGKTRIAKSIVDAAIKFSKRGLILTHHRASLDNYRNLPSYAFWLDQPQDDRWVTQYLAQPQMDYLPLNLLPDAELAKLRTPAKLERLLPVIESSSLSELTRLLEIELPHIEPVRVQLLAYRLKKLTPLLQQQLWLSQLYSSISQEEITELTEQVKTDSLVPIIGTVSEFMQPQQQFLWKTSFDLIIVEEAQYLTWMELMLLSGLGKKLILLGEQVPKLAVNSSFTNYPCFQWLTQHLFPTYVYQLTEQFRLHRDIAKLIYPVVCHCWMSTQRLQIANYSPQIKQRLVWRDIPHEAAGEQIIQYIRENLSPQLSSQMGIMTFSTQERDWLRNYLPEEFSGIFIGIVAEWVGKERAIAIIDCAENPENVPHQDMITVLTRGQDYLILFGDADLWEKDNSPIQSLLLQPELYKERRVVLS